MHLSIFIAITRIKTDTWLKKEGHALLTMPVWLKKKWHLDLDQMWGEFKLSTSQKEKSFPVAQKL